MLGEYRAYVVVMVDPVVDDADRAPSSAGSRWYSTYHDLVLSLAGDHTSRTAPSLASFHKYTPRKTTSQGSAVHLGCLTGFG